MRRGVFLLFVILFVILYFTGLSSFGLTEPDEPRYAEAAREMLEMGSYVTPYYNYRPRWEKPPLFYWLEMASYKLFGVSERSARIPSVVMAFMTAFFLMFVLFKLEGKAQGMLAFVLFLSMPYVFVISHLSITDMTLCFFVTVSSYSMLLFLEGWGGRWRTLSYLSMALGLLTKGPVAFLLPIPASMIYLVSRRRFREVSSIFSLPDVLLFLVVSLPWFVYLYREVGFGFIYRQTVARYFVGVWHEEPLHFFIPYVLGGALPQFFLALSPSGRERGEAFRFSLLYALYVFAFFSLSSCKLPNYILPIFPPIAASLACALKEALTEVVVSACLIFFFLVKLFLLPAYGSRLSIRPLFEGRTFERGASFLYYKKPYKAYPFYVRSRVWRIEDPREALSFPGPAYVLIKGEFLDRLLGLGFEVVSKSTFRDKELFLVRLGEGSPPLGPGS